MRVEHLKEAEQIVKLLAWFASSQPAFIDGSALGSLRLWVPAPPGRPTQTDFAMTRPAADAALAAMRLGWAAREAELRRRAAQIGLTL